MVDCDCGMVVRLLDYKTLGLDSYTKARGQRTFCGEGLA